MGSSSTTIGYWYLLAYHHGLCKGPIDVFGEYRGGNKTAWSGQLTSSGALAISARELWGGEKDQGGIEGTLRVMFGEADQMPNSYLVSTFGEQTAAWRGMTTVVFEGGRYGAMNPYPQKPAYRVRRIVKGWDGDYCWYEATAPVPLSDAVPGSGGGSGGDFDWVFRLAGSGTLSPSPDGVDWTSTLEFSGVFETAGTVALFGNNLVNFSSGGFTRVTDWTVPGDWESGPNMGACSLLVPRPAVINGRLWIARGAHGYSHTDDPLADYVQGDGHADLILGDDTRVVRYSNSTYEFWYAIAPDFDDWIEASNIPTSGTPGTPDYAYAIHAAGYGNGRGAVGGNNWDQEPVVFWSNDGFVTKHAAVLPAGMSASVNELMHVQGDEWLAFLAQLGVDSAAPGAVLRSLDGCETFVAADLPDASATNQYSGNAGVDRRTGRVVTVLQTDAGTQIWQSDDRTNWYQRDFVAGYPPAEIFCINPAASGGTPGTPDRVCMNPVHMLLYSHTQHDTGREAFDTVNLDHATIQADWYYDERFGLCTARRPEAESPAEFRGRIEKVAACSFTRSMADGLWYVDIANGVYEFDDLPILTDDDVLDFRETPTVLSEAINSVSVKYFDPWRKETVVTPPIRAMGLVAEYGEIHQTYDYPEIPTGPIAVRVSTRELLSSVTPTRRFDLATTRKPYSWRRNTYFRLQLPKRGITDMVCLLAELQHGQLKSGAIKLKAVQDIYSLPSTVYTEVEEGVDTRPSQTPLAIVDQRVIEAPYMNVVGSMRAIDFDALEADVGFAVGIAADPGRSRDFTMMVAPSGGTYVEKDNGDFCPTALSVGAVEPGNTTGITLANGHKLAQVEVGSVVLWDDEICRVDALDLDAGTVDLGRGCADTVPALHLAGSRLFFYTDYAAADPTEYTDGEALDIKLLSNTGSRRLPLASATAMALTMRRRIDRPLPPGGLALNGEPFYASGAITTVPPGGGGGGGGGGGVPETPPPPGSDLPKTGNPTTDPDHTSEFIRVGYPPKGYVKCEYHVVGDGRDSFVLKGVRSMTKGRGSIGPNVQAANNSSSASGDASLNIYGIALTSGSETSTLHLPTELADEAGVPDDAYVIGTVDFLDEPDFALMNFAERGTAWSYGHVWGGGIEEWTTAYVWRTSSQLADSWFTTGLVRMEIEVTGPVSGGSNGTRVGLQATPVPTPNSSDNALDWWSSQPFPAPGIYVIEVDATDSPAVIKVRDDAGTEIESGELTLPDDAVFRLYWTSGEGETETAPGVWAPGVTIRCNLGNWPWDITPTAGFGGVPKNRLPAVSQWSRESNDDFDVSAEGRRGPMYAVSSLLSPVTGLIKTSVAHSTGHHRIRFRDQARSDQQRVGMCRPDHTGPLGVGGDSVSYRNVITEDRYHILTWIMGGVTGSASLPVGFGRGGEEGKLNTRPTDIEFELDVPNSRIRVYIQEDPGTAIAGPVRHFTDIAVPAGAFVGAMYSTGAAFAECHFTGTRATSAEDW